MYFRVKSMKSPAEATCLKHIRVRYPEWFFSHWFKISIRIAFIGGFILGLGLNIQLIGYLGAKLYPDGAWYIPIYLLSLVVFLSIIYVFTIIMFSYLVGKPDYTPEKNAFAYNTSKLRRYVYTIITTNRPLDKDKLLRLISMPGSGGINIIDEYLSFATRFQDDPELNPKGFLELMLFKNSYKENRYG